MHGNISALVDDEIGFIEGVAWFATRAVSIDAGTFIGIADMRNATVITDIVIRMQTATGCTWKIAQTAISQINHRSVRFECVHRVPTHVGERAVEFTEGCTCMSNDNNKVPFICVRVCLRRKICWLLDKVKDTVNIVGLTSFNHYKIGDSCLSFACDATLTFHKTCAGTSIVVCEWNHNHDLDGYATLGRRSHATFVKDHFKHRHNKGVPAMRAWRDYVDHLLKRKTKPDMLDISLLGDRFRCKYFLTYVLT